RLCVELGKASSKRWGVSKGEAKSSERGKGIQGMTRTGPATAKQGSTSQHTTHTDTHTQHTHTHTHTHLTFTTHTHTQHTHTTHTRTHRHLKATDSDSISAH